MAHSQSLSDPKREDTLQEALVACLKGERWAQNWLYQRYKTSLFGVCLRYADDRASAEDLLQEGFIRIFTRLDQYKGEGSFEGWMRRVMVHTAIEAFRKKNRRISTQSLQDETTEPFAEWSFADQMSLDQLLALIQALPEGCRTVFNLFAVEGYSHKEIAELLGITEGTSRSQLAFARKKLILALQPSITYATR
jgi:RNA polymerase sigma factor (sigma-70 family)